MSREDNIIVFKDTERLCESNDRIRAYGTGRQDFLWRLLVYGRQEMCRAAFEKKG